jgi:uncharacterized protein (DUF1684 family)
MTETLQTATSRATGTATSTATDPATNIAAPDAAAARKHAAWRAARERGLREPHGPLSQVALHWPTAVPRRLPGIPGEWWVADRTLFTRPVPGDRAVLVGDQVEPVGPTLVGVDEGRSRIVGTFLPEGRVSSGEGADDEHEVAVEVVLRTGRYAVRPLDPQAATRTGFDHVPAFDHDPAWVLDVPVTWYEDPEPVTVGAAQPRLVHHVAVLGEVDVAHEGAVVTLALTGSRTEPTLLFSDEADGVAPWRILRIPAADWAPATSGTLRLDLNRAVNLPYAFTDFGTCPAPLAGNHLPFAVTAGERAPR